MNLTDKDLSKLDTKGISIQQLQTQLETFEKGIAFADICDAATKDNKGIIELADSERNQFINKYETSKAKVVKFTPASGAATRMFKKMYHLLEISVNENEFKTNLLSEDFSDLYKLAEQLQELAFYPNILKTAKQKYPDFENLEVFTKAYTAFRLLLNPNDLNFGNLPKGLIPFHQYQSVSQTPFEEHFYEAAAYASNQNNAQLHFTVAQPHIEKFEQNQQENQHKIEQETGKIFSVDYSFQEEYTDTIAVDLTNKPIRNQQGELFFRPGGHGALIQNLNQIDADIVFIKNIDNIPHRSLLNNTATYKKALAGVLIDLQEKTFSFLEELDQNPSQEVVSSAKKFLEEELKIQPKNNDVATIKKLLNRPIRVCGMVKNEGAPGGGPFWMTNGNGETSLQIVEKNQIDLNDSKQRKILETATHFNPVDLVCGMKNYKGEKFNLLNYVNPNRGFISHKTIASKEIKALELPGLWNGAMEYWNTVFVEVPLNTFCPVKSITDLLHPLHLQEA
ncbi:MAG: DUF4301 family protein [Bacteroidota bacterium]